MARVLLAFADVGMAVQLQEGLEAIGHDVRWAADLAGGPTDGPMWADAVILTSGSGSDELAEIARRWRDAEPPPALLLVETTSGDRELAAAARVTFLPASSTAPAISDAIDRAIELRYAGGLSSSSPLEVGLRSLGLQSAGETVDKVMRLIAAARSANVEMVREALRWHAADYVTISPDWLALLREHRALTIPEVELSQTLDGTCCLQSVLRGGKLEPWQAARFVWALVSAGVARFTAEPPDQNTARRRRLVQARHHLAARRARLARASYYDVLEVTREASAHHVDAAVETLALRYAPERLGRLDLSRLASLVAPTWDQITEAHNVLTDSMARPRYDRWLAAQSGVTNEWGDPSINSPNATRMMARGQASLVAGELFKAVSDMAAACRMHPGHPDYEASLAWARYRAEASRNQDRRPELAHRERQVAEAALAGHRPWPRALLALGLLCVADADADAARWHLHEALACDPNLPAAVQLLQRIGKG